MLRQAVRVLPDEHASTVRTHINGRPPCRRRCTRAAGPPTATAPIDHRCTTRPPTLQSWCCALQSASLTVRWTPWRHASDDRVVSRAGEPGPPSLHRPAVTSPRGVATLRWTPWTYQRARTDVPCSPRRPSQSRDRWRHPVVRPWVSTACGRVAACPRIAMPTSTLSVSVSSAVIW